jgi:D-alanyl-D-alanine carboxypeptidase
MGRETNLLPRRDFLKFGGMAAAGLALSPFSADAAEAAPLVRARADIAFIPGCPEMPLHKFNEDKIVYPASLTKIMTVMLLLDEVRKGNLDLDRDMIEITDEARIATVKGGWNLPEKQSRTVAVREAIQLAMARSYNDVAYSIAQRVANLEHNQQKIFAAGYTAANEETFCKVLMAEKIKELGMDNTRFCNSHGLPPHDTDVIIIGDKADYFNISTATDLAKMWSHMLTEYGEFRPLLSAPVITAPDGYSKLVNTTLQLKNMVTQCRTLCSGFNAKDVISKSGTSDLGRNAAFSVPRRVPSCDGIVEVAFLAIGYSTASARNVAARDMTNRVFSKLRPAQVAERQAMIEAKRIPPIIPSIPVIPLDESMFFSIPHIEPVEYELPVLESRPLIERIFGIPLTSPEIIR